MRPLVRLVASGKAVATDETLPLLTHLDK